MQYVLSTYCGVTLLFRFVESLPQPRGTQSLTGVPIASEGHDRPTVQFDLTEGTTAPTVTDQVAALRLEMLQMMRDMQTAMMTQMNAHMGVVICITRTCDFLLKLIKQLYRTTCIELITK